MPIKRVVGSIFSCDTSSDVFLYQGLVGQIELVGFFFDTNKQMFGDSDRDWPRSRFQVGKGDASEIVRIEIS